MEFNGENLGPQEIAQLAKMFMENKDDIEEMIESFRPVVSSAICLVMDTIGPEVESIATRVALGTVSIRREVFSAYIAEGFFTREEALALMLNDSANSTKAVNAVNDGVSKAVK